MESILSDICNRKVILQQYEEQTCATKIRKKMIEIVQVREDEGSIRW